MLKLMRLESKPWQGIEMLEPRILLSVESSLLTAPPIDALAITVVDSDGDGLPDDWETASGLIVGAQDAFVDPDRDGLLSFEEWQRNSEPLTAAAPGGDFSLTTSVGTQDAPLDVLSADFNRDGNVDVAALTATTIEIRMGAGDGSLGAATILIPQLKAGSSGPHRLTAGDFNWDGLLDLAVVTDSSSSRVEAFLNNGDGTYTSSFYQDIVWFTAQEITVADFDMNGQQDFLTVNNGQRDWKVFQGQGDGAFSPLAFGQSSASFSHLEIIRADFDEDQDIDFATVGENQVTLRYNDGTGQFGQTWGGTLFGGQSAAVAGSSIDFNNDNHVDIAIYGGTQVRLKPGDGAGGFLTDVLIDVGEAGTDIKSADVNGDGYADLVLAAQSNKLIVLLSDGAGGFEAPYDVPLTFAPIAISVADYNNDDILDVVAIPAGNNVHLLLGMT